MYRACITLLDLLDLLEETSNKVKKRGTIRERMHSKETRYESAMRKAREEAFRIISEFTGRKSLHNFLMHFWSFLSKIKEDSAVSLYFSDLRYYLIINYLIFFYKREFIIDTLERPRILETENHAQYSRELIRRGRHLFWYFKEKEDFSWLLKEAKVLINRVFHDPIIIALSTDIQRFAKDSILDEHGKVR